MACSPLHTMSSHRKEHNLFFLCCDLFFHVLCICLQYLTPEMIEPLPPITLTPIIGKIPPVPLNRTKMCMTSCGKWSSNDSLFISMISSSRFITPYPIATQCKELDTTVQPHNHIQRSPFVSIMIGSRE